MSRNAKCISGIVLQIISAFILIGVKGWEIGYVTNYDIKFNAIGGYKDVLFAAIEDYSVFVNKYEGYPSFPTLLIILVFILMVIIVAYYVLQLSGKSTKYLNYKVMCAVSGIALLLTLYLFLFPFGNDGTFSYYLKHENPGVKFIVLVCVIATFLLVFIGEKNSNSESGEAIAMKIDDFLPKKKGIANTSILQTSEHYDVQSKKNDANTDWANTLIKYKELLDEGIITQDEFEKKKKELLK